MLINSLYTIKSTTTFTRLKNMSGSTKKLSDGFEIVI